MSEYNKVEMVHRTGFNLRDYLVVNRDPWDSPLAGFRIIHPSFLYFSRMQSILVETTYN